MVHTLLENPAPEENLGGPKRVTGTRNTSEVLGGLPLHQVKCLEAVSQGSIKTALGSLFSHYPIGRTESTPKGPI